jgi:Leucine-rich repeat (LRR) protein
VNVVKSNQDIFQISFLVIFFRMDELKSRFVTCLQDGARDLDLSGLELPLCPPQVESNAKLQTLVRLTLSFNKISRFPELQQLTRLGILHIAGNALASLAGDSFASLSRLRELTLNGNALVALPASIGAFTKLEKLDVSNNKLSALPNEIGYLGLLVELRCSGNPLASVPRTIRSCGHLELASFDFCQLTTLPSEVTYCSRLLELGLANNRLRELPRDFGRLTRLTTLNISNNSITDLPISMGRCASLGDLGAGVQLDGNPIGNAQLLKARSIGPDHLMFFLEKRMQSIPGGGELFEVPWHGLIEQRDLSRKNSSQQSGLATTIALPSQAAPGVASTSGAVAEEHRSRREESQRKADALKRWAHEQINNVYQPRLRQIRAAVEKIQTAEQGQALLAFMHTAAPSIAAVAELLPDLEPPDVPKIDASLPPVQVCRVQLQFACQSAKDTLESCEHLLAATSNVDTLVALVKALKNVQLTKKE